MKNIRVRFAPSPTGVLHLGNIRTAIYNYIFAKKNKGKFILRIEDTDKNRFLTGIEKYIIEILDWCGLCTDESPPNIGKYGPYKQSDRKHLYNFYIQKLIENKHAYFAFDSPNIELKMNSFTYNARTRFKMNNSLSIDTKNLIDNLKLPYVIRFKTPKNKLISVFDQIRGEIKINTSSIDDKILVKSDGMVTYHLANVIDDHLMKITHVIRGEEWLSSLPLHILIYEAFEWKKPFFAHLPLLLKTSGCGKLSKRDGGEMIFGFKYKNNIALYSSEEGYFPEAILNMLALLGWNSVKAKEFFCIKKLEKKFNIKRVQKSGAIFNKEKANWINRQYLQRKPIKNLMILFKREFNKNGAYIYDNKLIKVIKTIKNRVSFVQELWKNAYYFFIGTQKYDNHHITFNIFSVLRLIQISFLKEKNFHYHNLKRIIKFLIYDRQLLLKQVFKILRISLVGILTGGDVLLIMEILEKKETIERIIKYY